MRSVDQKGRLLVPGGQRIRERSAEDQDQEQLRHDAQLAPAKVKKA
jgi:hypothetical protein